MAGIVISLFDYTTTMVEPWAKAGHLCYCVDLQHAKGETKVGNVVKIGADIREWIPPMGVEVAFVAAFPPCTHLATSGARWFKGKGLHALAGSIELFARAAGMCEASGAPYLIENPVGTISTYWRPPDYKFHPYEYGGYAGGEDDSYTKETWLWTGGGFVMPQIRRIEPYDGSKMHRLPPGPERANKRAATPRGFAQAVWYANQERTNGR